MVRPWSEYFGIVVEVVVVVVLAAVGEASAAVLISLRTGVVLWLVEVLCEVDALIEAEVLVEAEALVEADADTDSLDDTETESEVLAVPAVVELDVDPSAPVDCDAADWLPEAGPADWLAAVEPVDSLVPCDVEPLVDPLVEWLVDSLVEPLVDSLVDSVSESLVALPGVRTVLPSVARVLRLSAVTSYEIGVWSDTG